MELNKKDLIAYRPAVADDIPFIFATWLKGLRYGNAWFKAIDEKVYYREYHKVIEKALRQHTVTVACLREDTNVILGFSVHSVGILHWVYVKSAWRNIGIAKALVPEHTHTVSNLTDLGLEIILSDPTLKFNPFVL